MDDPMIAGLLDLIVEQRHQGRTLDLIILSGGLAATGERAEYEIVSYFCDSLLEAAGLDELRERLIVVPGASDISVDAARGLADELTSADAEQYFASRRRGPHFTKIEAYEDWRRLYFQGQREPPPGSTCGPIAEFIVDGESVSVLPINTVLFANNDSVRDHGKLRVGREPLRAALQEIKGSSLRICVMHHSPDWLHPDESERASNALARHLDILLHGHTEHLYTMTLHGSGTCTKLPQLSPGAARKKASGGVYFGKIEGSNLHIFPFAYSDHTERWHEDLSRKREPLELPHRQQQASGSIYLSPPPKSSTTTTPEGGSRARHLLQHESAILVAPPLSALVLSLSVFFFVMSPVFTRGLDQWHHSLVEVASIHNNPRLGSLCPRGMSFVPGGVVGINVVPDRCWGTTEVTMADYKRCVSLGYCDKPGVHSGCNYGQEGREHHPINCVRWKDAMAFCEAMGQQLPTGSEYQWAASGGLDGRHYPWGHDPPDCSYTPTELECGAKGTSPVGERKHNVSKHGLYDMSGNVAEWTRSPEHKGTRTTRGGGWKANELKYFKTSESEATNAVGGGALNKTGTPNDIGFADVGFRCVTFPSWR